LRAGCTHRAHTSRTVVACAEYQVTVSEHLTTEVTATEQRDIEYLARTATDGTAVAGTGVLQDRQTVEHRTRRPYALQPTGLTETTTVVYKLITNNCNHQKLVKLSGKFSVSRTDKRRQ